VTTSPDTARQAGSGVFWLTLAKLYFMATGFLLVIFLPKLFEKLSGDTTGEVYGEYRVVVGLINLLNMVLIGGALQAVSKFVSEREDRVRSVKWQTLRLQAIIGGGLTGLLFFGADTIATRFYGQPDLAFYLRLASPIVLLYSFYAVIIGCMNGLKRFRHQATMDILFATLKVALTIGLVAAGMAISGAIGGFLATAAVLLVLATAVLGKLPPGEAVSWRTLLSFEWKTLLYAFFLNGLLQVDLQLLMALAPPELGTPESQTGIYGLALQLGQLPYVATISVAFVVFPLVSGATFANDLQRARDYVATTNRYVLAILAGLVTVIACDAQSLMSLSFFPAVYASGAKTFAILSVGYLFFASVMINANIFTASGKPTWSMFLFAGMLALSTLLNALAIPRFGGEGAAAASSIAMFGGFVAAAFLCRRLFGSFLPASTLVRTVLAAAVVAGIHFVIPHPGGLFWLVLRLGLGFVLYCGLLLALGEFRLAELKGVLARRRGR
jgi:O-antigen/teichoic acid export membrane protein